MSEGTAASILVYCLLLMLAVLLREALAVVSKAHTRGRIALQVHWTVFLVSQ